MSDVRLGARQLGLGAAYLGEKEIKRIFVGGAEIWEGVHERVNPPCLLFSSPSSFTFATHNKQKNWNGTLEWSTDGRLWREWDGESTLDSVSTEGTHRLYLLGYGNTFLTSGSSLIAAENARLELIGSNISCAGNIESLLDFSAVESGTHPQMKSMCFGHLFTYCTGLISAPTLPATTLPGHCYQAMFYGCTGLISAPALPAVSLSAYCYTSMFYGCTGLTSIPELPAVTLENSCYSAMFSGCSKIKLSTSQTGTYQSAYRIPKSGSGITGSLSMLNMFKDTGGTFTGTPTINTTYYTSNTVVEVN